jgi:serine/threonine protein kinase
MNPTDDTLNDGATLRRPDGTGDASTNDLNQAVTIRMPGTGMMMFSRYKLLRTLGRGGMGIVWLAEDTKLGRQVALKFLPDVVGADEVALQELMDETRRGLDLAHPNIVRIYDLLSDDTMAAISMEFVDGKNLSERRLVKPNGVYTVDDVRPWLGQLCSALDYAHLQKRLVHRDLKPANLMLNWDGELKVTDFGIARSVSDAVSRLSRVGHTSGTLPYMSPQQVMGERPRPTDDVYSVGATLYELFTGKPPFYSGDVNMQITQKVPPSMRERREDLETGATDVIPQDWEDAVAACLQKEPSKRPQTSGELARMLGLSTSCTDTHTVGPKQQPHLAEKLGLVGHEPAASNPLKPKPCNLQLIAVGPPPAPPNKMPALAVMIGALVALLVMAGVAFGAVWWTFFRTGEWVIETEPSGAKVSVIGTECVSPATIEGLKPGLHKASVSLDGYEPRDIEVEISAGQRTSPGAVKLERSTGELRLSSEPEETRYEVVAANDTGGNAEKFTGETPDIVRLPVGTYSVTMKHDGELKTAEVTIVRNEMMRQKFTFDKLEPPPPPRPSVLAATTSPSILASAVAATTPAPSSGAAVSPAPLASDPPGLALPAAPAGVPGTAVASTTPAPAPAPMPPAEANTTPAETSVSGGTLAASLAQNPAPPANVIGTLAVPPTQAPLVASTAPPPIAQPSLPSSLDATPPPQMIVAQPPTPSTLPSVPPPAIPSSVPGPTGGSSSADLLTGGDLGGQGPAPMPSAFNPATLTPPPTGLDPATTAPTIPGGSTITADPTNTLPVAPGTVVGPPAAPGPVPPQPAVVEPPSGHWKLDEILANSEYAEYSEPGRSYLVYKAQQAMKQSADGVPGKGTYKAITQFQTEHGLQPTGQLDSATLVAMNLSGQPDNSDWSRGSGSSGRSRNYDPDRTPESEKTKFRKMIEKNVLGGRDLRDVFRRR